MKRTVVAIVILVQLGSSVVLGVLMWRLVTLEVTVRRALRVLEGGCL